MSKQKTLGTAGENGVVDRANKHPSGKLKARRQPMSGVLKEFPKDVVIEAGEVKVLGEVKVRSLTITPTGSQQFTINYDWLLSCVEAGRKGGFDHAALFIRPKSSQRRFVLVEESVYLDLLAGKIG